MADFFIDLGDISELIRKDITQTGDYDVPSFLPPEDIHVTGGMRPNGREPNHQNSRQAPRGFSEDVSPRSPGDIKDDQ